MWNLLEKGKELAANIDKQLNESVGVDTTGPSVPPSVSRPTTTTATTTITTHNGDDDLNDAWNDDDDFGFDDDVDLNNKNQVQDKQDAVTAQEEQPAAQQPGSGWEADDDQLEGLETEENDGGMMTQFDVQQQQQQQLKDEKTVPAAIEPEQSALAAPIDEAASPTPPIDTNGVGPDTPSSPTEEDLPPPEHKKEDTNDGEALATDQSPIDPVAVPEETTDEPPQGEGGWEEDLYDGNDDVTDGIDDVTEAVTEGGIPAEEQLAAEDDKGPEEPTEQEASGRPPVDLNDRIVTGPPVREIVLAPDDDDEMQHQQEEEEEGREESGDDQDQKQGDVAVPSGNVYDSLINEEMMQQQNQQQKEAMAKMQRQLDQLQAVVGQREDQLAQKAEQLASMQAMHEAETNELKSKIRDTKEEAKRRIQKAKERVEAMEASLQSAGRATEAVLEKEEIINALRHEGEALARKQSEMEKAVRTARGDARHLQGLLDQETNEKEDALTKIANLEAELKSTRDDLASARKGESQASKLDMELSSVKEECEKRAATNLALEQNAKELRAELKELKKEMSAAQKGAALENKRESNKLRKEHGDMLTEMETKLRNSEREAGVREDSLRQEVADLRKRWQDAIRRADCEYDKEAVTTTDSLVVFVEC